MIGNQSYHFFHNPLVTGHHTAVIYTQTAKGVVVLCPVSQGYIHAILQKWVIRREN